MQFGYKHLLQRHTAKAHPTTPLPHIFDEHSVLDKPDEYRESKSESEVDIDFLTGKAYADRAKDRLATEQGVACPCPNFPAEFLESGGLPSSSAFSASFQESSPPCKYVFSRAYDLRRHLRAEHDLEVCKEVVDNWVKRVKNTAGRQD